MLHRGMDRAALDAAYNNTEAVGVPSGTIYVAGWSARSDAFRQARGGKIDLRYGDGARQRLDVFPCGTTGAPTLAYIHGGYWQTNDKEAARLSRRGAPARGVQPGARGVHAGAAARMDQIVGEVRAAVAWVIDHAKEVGGDPARVYVSGHSAGGHLTAMAMTDARVAGGVAISGLYDLEPVRSSYQREAPARPGRGEAQQPHPALAAAGGAARGHRRPRRAARARSASPRSTRWRGRAAASPAATSPSSATTISRSWRSWRAATARSSQHSRCWRRDERRLAIATPASLGFEPRQLQAIESAFRRGRLRQLHGVVIVRRGQLSSSSTSPGATSAGASRSARWRSARRRSTTCAR